MSEAATETNLLGTHIHVVDALARHEGELVLQRQETSSSDISPLAVKRAFACAIANSPSSIADR